MYFTLTSWHSTFETKIMLYTQSNFQKMLDTFNKSYGCVALLYNDTVIKLLQIMCKLLVYSEFIVNIF